MKIGTITFQDGINFGAYWQAYALHKVLQKLSNNKNQIINYKNPKHFITELLVFYHKIYKPAEVIQNHKKIQKFKVEQKQFSQTPFTLNKESLKKLDFDIVFYGSDEIWNYKNPLFGYDKVYFGYPFKESKLISYAPSFGSVSKDTRLPKEIIQHLEKFERISVRDTNSQEIIKSNLGYLPEIVGDPTFLLDLKTDQKVSENNYILLYCTVLSTKQENEIIALAKKTGKKIISVGYPQRIADKSFTDIGPTEWLAYYQQSDFVITTMFHGTIFAIKNNKNFVTISSKYRLNKISGLLSQFNLLDRIYNNNLEKLYSREINYSVVTTKIDSLKKKSMKFLLSSLSGDF